MKFGGEWNERYVGVADQMKSVSEKTPTKEQLAVFLLPVVSYQYLLQKKRTYFVLHAFDVRGITADLWERFGNETTCFQVRSDEVSSSQNLSPRDASALKGLN